MPEPIRGFEYRAETRLVCGPGTLGRLGDLARELGATRALVTSDPGIVAAGHATAGIAALEQAGIVTALFSGFGENPSTCQIETGTGLAREFRPDLLVGLGGGSSMDCAKGINFLFSCGGRMQDYHGRGRATGPMLPSIGVPTTAGTGSETQSFALVTDVETGMKMACGDPRAAFRVAILDVTLTLTQPAAVAALTGIDAVSHAVRATSAAMPTPRLGCFPGRPGGSSPRICPECSPPRTTSPPARPCNSAPPGPAWRSSTRCSARPTRSPTR